MERLLAGDADIYGELLGRYADLDLQHLRQLVREAQKLQAAAVTEEENTVSATPNKYQRRLQKYCRDWRWFMKTEACRFLTQTPLNPGKTGFLLS